MLVSVQWVLSRMIHAYNKTNNLRILLVDLFLKMATHSKVLSNNSYSCLRCKLTDGGALL